MNDIKTGVQSILADYDPSSAQITAELLCELWLPLERKSMAGIKAEQRAIQKTDGIAVAALKMIGKEIGRAARQRVEDFMPLVQILWNEFGREGRVVALIPLGVMELEEPERIIPLLKELCRTCVTWEDADRLAMDGLEPIVRRDPRNWLGVVESWLVDENKWVRRAAVIVIGRLPMKHPAYTGRCLGLIEHLVADPEVDVRKATSFAIRLAARGEVKSVRDFLINQIPPNDPAATWVLCDAISSMTKNLLPDLTPLLPKFQQWAQISSLNARERRSIESAIRALFSAQTQ